MMCKVEKKPNMSLKKWYKNTIALFCLVHIGLVDLTETSEMNCYIILFFIAIIFHNRRSARKKLKIRLFGFKR